MTIKIASWNIEGRLTNGDVSSRSTPSGIVDAIKNIDADIVVLLEAHGQISPDNLKAKKQLQNIGYKIYDVPYDDDSSTRSDSFYKQHSMVMLGKLPIKKFEAIRLGNLRNAMMANITDKNGKELRVIGVHLDDRCESTRVDQVKDLAKIINSSKLPTVVMGDFNAMHGNDLVAKLLRSKPARSIAHLFQLGIAERAVGMASGEALKLFQSSTGLVDADPKHQPTTTPKMRGQQWIPSWRLIQIDHIFISTEIQIHDFTISPDYGSDHRAISATVTM